MILVEDQARSGMGEICFGEICVAVCLCVRILSANHLTLRGSFRAPTTNFLISSPCPRQRPLAVLVSPTCPTRLVNTLNAVINNLKHVAEAQNRRQAGRALHGDGCG